MEQVVAECLRTSRSATATFVFVCEGVRQLLHTAVAPEWWSGEHSGRVPMPEVLLRPLTRTLMLI